MTEFIAEYYCVNGKSLVYIQDLFPANGFDLFVNSVSIFCGEVLDGF